jgi:LuxR family transcriptional regulator, maltose regulon positive regulatory protein
MVLDVKRGRPPSRDGLIPRSRLIARLRHDEEVPLLTVIAPAGYGKTSLLWEWLSDDRRDGAWLVLEEHHNDPVHLLQEIAGALEDIEQLPVALFDSLHVADPDIPGVVLPCVLSALALRGRPTAIVLDDAHVLTAPAALRIVGSLAERLPADSQLALASRTVPPLHLGRMRARGALLELRAEDLAMTHVEAGGLLEMAGLNLTAAELDLLMERTEGWPAGLYLAALSLRDEPDVSGALARFTGGDRVVGEYIWEEFLAELPSEALDFLVSTSVLDELHAPLCDAVLAREGSSRVLERLARAANLPLVPLDRSGGRYRCHRLLRDTLLAELHREEPLGEFELHRRASVWHSAHGEIDRSIEHAVRAHDIARTGDLLWENFLHYAAHGRNSEVQRWLGAFGIGQLASSPSLAVVAAHSSLMAGDLPRSEHLGLVAAGAMARTHSLAEMSAAAAASLPAGIMLIGAAAARDGVAQMGRDAARAYELESPDGPWRSLSCLLRGVAEHLLADRVKARRHLEEGAQNGAVGAPAIEILCLAQLATLHIEGEDLEMGVACVDRALAQIERHRLDTCPTSAVVLAVAASVHSRVGRVEESQRELRHATRLSAMLESFAPWYEAQTRIALARAALALADVRQARTLLAEASQRARRVSDATVLRLWLDQIWEQLDTAATFALSGSAALTMAELRILRFLPTHLSFREIGLRLHVSTNTVKTQAHAVYRKLDVSSRSHAVARAGEIGLLDA